ncbi:Dienelactone hydrolase OS=Streptomyces alboniger OX=132473 GN=CP975_09025 PE=4 SV=1 [Streptomyces alboniger]
MNIVLFHSTYGLRPAVRQAADRLRDAGHQVWTPDLFEGRTFDTVEEGMAHRTGSGGRSC